jgi:hypothetical protein
MGAPIRVQTVIFTLPMRVVQAREQINATYQQREKHQSAMEDG